MSNQRIYQGSDAHMVESARTIHTLLSNDLPDFEAFSARFTSDYLAAFLVQIEAAETVVTDLETIAQQASKTEEVLSAMEVARRVYRKAKNYAELTFANTNPAIVKEFTKGYGAARQNQPKMTEFLEVLERTLERHAADLQAPEKGGMPASFISEVAQARENLLNKNIDQESFIKTRLETTEERLKILNDCYKTLAQINNTAQVVYEDSPAKRAQYTYRPYSGTSDTEVYSGNVAPGEVKSIASFVYAPDQFITFENKGLIPLLFDIAPATATLSPDAFEGNLVDLGGGATVNQTMDWLNNSPSEGDAVQLLVYNPSASETGVYEIGLNLE